MGPVLRYLLFAVSLSWSLTLPAQVVINEYCASNKTQYTDAFGDHPDWIELYNSGTVAANLQGLFLTDSPGNLQKYALPNVTLNAGQHLLILASTRDGYFSGYYHANFKLTQMKAEKLILSQTSGTILDSVTLRPTQADHSRGRVTDGATTWGVFTSPSPDNSNANAYLGYAAKPNLSLPSGFYSGAGVLIMTTSEPNATIRYTTNGSAPTQSSTAYTNIVGIPGTQVIRAATFSNNPAILPSFIETNSYFFNVNHHGLAVISMCSPDYNGLFGNLFDEIMTTFEYFDSTGALGHEGDGDIRGHGNDSWAYDQKGMRFYSRDDYGYANNIEEQLFETSPRDEFDVIILKAGASDNFPGGFINGLLTCHLRDVFSQTFSEKYDLNVDVRRWQPCVVYLNGQYWGIYEIRERIDPDYADYYYDQDPDSVDMLAYWGGLDIEAGSDTAWNSLYNFMVSNNLSIPANHDYVAERFELMSLIDYFILNTYMVNTDWLNWNTAWWRGRSTPGVKWRYRLWDQDNIYNLGQNYTGVGTTSYLNDPCNPTTLFPGDPSVPHGDMINALMADTAFEALYINRYADLLNTCLNCDTLLAHLQSIVDRIGPEMPQHCARWGGQVTDWNANLDSIRVQISGRCQVVDSLMVGCYNLSGPYPITVLVDPPGNGNVRVNTVIPTGYPYVATYYGGIMLDLYVVANQGYQFLNWTTLHHNLTPGTTADSVQLWLTGSDTIIAHFDNIFVGEGAPTDLAAYTFRVRPTLVRNRIQVEYQVPDAGAQLWLTDLQGHRIADLSGYVVGEASGKLEIDLSAMNLSRGMYFLSLQSAAWRKTEKLIWVGE